MRSGPMAERIRVKICGVTSLRDIEAAADADYVGFVFYGPSPRALRPREAGDLARRAPQGTRRVGLFVDPDMAEIDSALEHAPLDFLQLHGAESPERVDEIRRHSGLPVIKAVRLAGEEDLGRLDEAEDAADQVLCDAASDGLPGGNGVAFDWHLLAGRQWRRPWLLAGGLTPGNVAAAMRASGATQVDVSSGVEDSPGIKSPQRIRDFLAAARQ